MATRHLWRGRQDAQAHPHFKSLGSERAGSLALRGPASTLTGLPVGPSSLLCPHTSLPLAGRGQACGEVALFPTAPPFPSLLAGPFQLGGRCAVVASLSKKQTPGPAGPRSALPCTALPGELFGPGPRPLLLWIVPPAGPLPLACPAQVTSMLLDPVLASPSFLGLDPVGRPSCRASRFPTPRHRLLLPGPHKGWNQDLSPSQCPPLGCGPLLLGPLRLTQHRERHAPRSPEVKPLRPQPICMVSIPLKMFLYCQLSATDFHRQRQLHPRAGVIPAGT